jgi:hypothetical protein
MGPRCVLVFSLALALLGLVVAGPGGGAPPAKSSSTHRKKPDLPAFTPAREKAALQFVEKHHAELRQVLDRLQKLNREQYEQAIRELFQESARLAQVQKSDEKLYELLLESWKVKSRSEVLAARLACTKDERGDLEKELKSLLYRQVDLNRQQVEHNRNRLLNTLKAMEANIKLLQDKRDQIVERRFRALTRNRRKAGAERDN